MYIYIYIVSIYLLFYSCVYIYIYNTLYTHTDTMRPLNLYLHPPTAAVTFSFWTPGWTSLPSSDGDGPGDQPIHLVWWPCFVGIKCWFNGRKCWFKRGTGWLSKEDRDFSSEHWWKLDEHGDWPILMCLENGHWPLKCWLSWEKSWSHVQILVAPFSNKQM